VKINKYDAHPDFLKRGELVHIYGFKEGDVGKNFHKLTFLYRKRWTPVTPWISLCKLYSYRNLNIIKYSQTCFSDHLY